MERKLFKKPKRERGGENENIIVKWEMKEKGWEKKMKENEKKFRQDYKYIYFFLFDIFYHIVEEGKGIM